MRLLPLLELEFRYTALEYVGPIIGQDGAEGIAWGLAEGAVSGERVRGSHRSCNHPRRRTDNVNVPDVHGIITTDDGEKIYYELRGYGILDGGSRRTIGSATFRTASDLYGWLNTTVAVDEGRFGQDASGADVAPIRFYECVPD